MRRKQPSHCLQTYSQSGMLQQRPPLMRQNERFAKAGADPMGGHGGMKDTPRMTNDEMMAQLGRGKDKSEGMTASIRDSLREMNEMMDDHEAQKKPGADLRNGMPAQLEKLNDAWLQTDDLGAVRDAMNQDADAQKVARYEDEYSVISRCRFKYNPIHELQRYIPAVGVRALLTNRGVAVEILGDPRDLADAKRWKRRIRIASSQASCGPMDRPTGERHVPSTFPLQSSTVSSFFKRRSIAGAQLLEFTDKSGVNQGETGWTHPLANL